MTNLPSETDPTEQEMVVIPRNHVFVLVDGTFAVRWNDKQIQELESGRYRPFHKKDFGAFITDYELQQLKKAGLIKMFDKERVELCPLPERRERLWVSVWEAHRTRSYYLNTTLPGHLLDDIVQVLSDLGLAGNFVGRVRDNFVVLWSSKGISFAKFDDAEKARALLAAKAPDAFANTVVAFIETTTKPH